MEHTDGYKGACPLHHGMEEWKKDIDRCLFDNETGMQVKITKMVEGLKIVQKVVYAAVAFGLLAFANSILKVVGR